MNTNLFILSTKNNQANTYTITTNKTIPLLLILISNILFASVSVEDSPGDKLWKASWDNNTETVKLLLKTYTDPISQYFAVEVASQKGHLEIVRLLVENDVPLDFKGRENTAPLLFAAEYGYLEIVRLLLKNGANIHVHDDMALVAAAQEGHLEIIELLLENGADPGAQNSRSIKAAKAYGHTQIIKLLEDFKDSLNDRLIKASWDNNTAAVKLLLRAYVHDPVVKYLSLGTASQKGNLEIVRLLLEDGAPLNFQGREDTAPLVVATYNGHLEIVRLLLKNGADIHVLNSRVLECFALKNKGEYLKIVKLLLETGVDFNSLNGELPALRKGLVEGEDSHIEILKWLTENVASEEKNHDDIL